MVFELVEALVNFFQSANERGVINNGERYKPKMEDSLCHQFEETNIDDLFLIDRRHEKNNVKSLSKPSFQDDTRYAVTFTGIFP